jgi:hypothetical protein
MTAIPGVDGFTMKVDALYKVSEDKRLIHLTVMIY